MDTLTKKGFWNEMEQKYPRATANFLAWVDNYKKINDWNRILKDGVYKYTRNNGQVMTYKAPKFHELPVAMQFGIWFEYVGEVSGEAEKDGGMLAVCRSIITEGLEVTEEELNA